MEQNISTQDHVAMEQAWNRNVTLSGAVNDAQKNNVPDGIVSSDSNSDSNLENKPFTPHNQPPRKTKKAINYKGMFALFGQEADVNLSSTSKMYKADALSSAPWI